MIGLLNDVAEVWFLFDVVSRFLPRHRDAARDVLAASGDGELVEHFLTELNLISGLCAIQPHLVQISEKGMSRERTTSPSSPQTSRRREELGPAHFIRRRPKLEPV
jgi:hypothetical protein